MPELPTESLRNLQRFDTCAIANAIEVFDMHLRNEGYSKRNFGLISHPDARLLGYAVPCRVSTQGPPIVGHTFADRTDWWGSMQSALSPKIAVLQEVSPPEEAGAVAGEVHCAILQALGCQGLITNGAVRDLEGVHRLDFPLFAGGVCPSHGYPHLLDFGQPVDIFGLRVQAGDLLYADRHGIVSIPTSIVEALLPVLEQQASRDRRIVALCQSPDFSLFRLLHEVKDL